MYTDIGKGFAKTLTGPNNFVLNNAYLYCEAAGLTLGTFPGNIVGNVWQAKVTTDNGVIVYLVLRFTASAGYPQPCTESSNDSYAGKTFTGTQFLPGLQGQSLVITEFVGIILCPKQGHGVKILPTLAQGFTPDDQYASKIYSTAGTLVHEMVYVVGRSRATQWDDPAIGFDKCVSMARKAQAAALINQDNYRIFAELSMSPQTKWVAKPGKKSEAATS
ncbi:hypothetical protein ACEPPN_006342 [Leptodophora sp. 'Broadleaf-Isolate-01']